jgi:pimeloyl-ACP methyl ester carboxylesterase
MASFLLIDGAWHGAWCWREIVDELESRGHRAVAIDLPAHGSDPTPPEAVTFRDYVDAVCRAAQSFSHRIYSRCSADAVARAMPRLRPMPVAPLEHPLEITSERYGKIPRVYVECLQDRIIPVTLQREMVSECGCNRVYSLDTDHCPMFSDPAGLLRVLTSAAGQF